MNKENILKLKNGEKYIVPESDYGLAEIWLIHGTYFLFEIPMYGGEPMFVEAFRIYNIDNLIECYGSWT